MSDEPTRDEFLQDTCLELYGVPSEVLWKQIEIETQQKFDTFEDAFEFSIKYVDGLKSPEMVEGAIRSPDALKVGTSYKAYLEELEEPWILGKLLEIDLITYHAKFENNSIITSVTPEENEELRVDLATIGVVSFFDGRWSQAHTVAYA
jgi:hypothetical protein